MESGPITPTVLLPGGAVPPTPPAAKPSPSGPPKLFLTGWWLFKKFAWRNTAALLWIILVYAALTALAPAFGTSLPPVLSFLDTASDRRLLGVCAALWLFFICEFQLTQAICFGVYVLALPIWLPAFGIFHYLRNRFGTLTLKTKPFKARFLRLLTALLFSAIFLWWPLPDPLTAIVLGVVAFVPGFYLFRTTLRFALNPGRFMTRLRADAHTVYEGVKKETKPTEMTDEAKQKAAQRFEKWKSTATEWYERQFLDAVEMGLMRTLSVSYFATLFFASLLYIGFLAAIWLRGLSGTPEALAMALGRQTLPNLLYMAFICSFRVLAQVRIETSMLPPAAAFVASVANLTPFLLSVFVGGAFWAGYSNDIRRAESRAPGTEKT